MPKKASFIQDEAGRFQTAGLSEKAFIQVFKEITRLNNKRRQDAKRTLRPGQLSRKSVQDLVRLGKKPDGTEFTVDDLKRFDKLRKQYRKRRGGQQGITYLELVARSADTRIDRASNRSGDGREVNSAQLLAVKANVLTIKVKASHVSVHQHHRVEVRLEEWDQLMADANGLDSGYQKATKQACAGRLSINCSCGDHQYRYRYMATLGNYCLSPPKEFSYPKITNPNLSGLACKHVLLAARMMQSPTWYKRLSYEMAAQARRTGYGDVKRTTVYTGPDAKALARNKSKSIDTDAARAAWDKYRKNAANVAKRVSRGDEKLEKMRDQLLKTRKKHQDTKAKLREEQKANEALRRQAQQMMRDNLKMQLQAFTDAFKVAGMDANKAMEAFAKQKGITPSTLQELIK